MFVRIKPDTLDLKTGAVKVAGIKLRTYEDVDAMWPKLEGAFIGGFKDPKTGELVGAKTFRKMVDEGMGGNPLSVVNWEALQKELKVKWTPRGNGWITKEAINAEERAKRS